MSYIRKPGDKEYRVVSLKSAQEPSWRTFAENEEEVKTTTDSVIEIRKEDGSTALYYDAAKKSVVCTREAGCIRVPTNIPLARLWVRKENGEGIAYKIPVNLSAAGAEPKILVSNSGNVVVEGDEYLQQAYDIQMV